MVGLLIALLATSRPGDERAALLGPVVVAALVTAVTLSRRAVVLRVALPAALLLEVLVAALVVWVTGWHTSPLMLYLTAPLVHAALCRDGRVLGGLVAMALAAYVAPTFVDSAALRPGVTIEQIALLVLVPTLTWFTVESVERKRALPTLELSADDVVVARQLVAGRPYREIAEEQHLSVESVKVAVSRLYRRVGARNRDEAVRVIRELDLSAAASGSSSPHEAR